MRLYFLRHADAVHGANDHLRALSEKGETQARQIGRFCRGIGIRFNSAFTSPLIRTRQTAEGVLSITNESAPITPKVDDLLVNGASSTEFGEWLGAIPEQEHVLLVGHAPILALNAQQVLGMTRQDALSLPKGGLVCVEMWDQHRGTLIFKVSPRLLEREGE